jgi:hypothetical protein
VNSPFIAQFSSSHHIAEIVILSSFDNHKLLSNSLLMLTVQFSSVFHKSNIMFQLLSFISTFAFFTGQSITFIVVLLSVESVLVSVLDEDPHHQHQTKNEEITMLAIHFLMLISFLYSFSFIIFCKKNKITY